MPSAVLPNVPWFIIRRRFGFDVERAESLMHEDVCLVEIFRGQYCLHCDVRPTEMLKLDDCLAFEERERFALLTKCQALKRTDGFFTRLLDLIVGIFGRWEAERFHHVAFFTSICNNCNSTINRSTFFCCH